MKRNENVIQIIRNNYRVVGKLFRYSKEFRKSYILALVINAFTMVRFSFVIGFSIQWVTDTALSGEWNAFRNAVLFAAIAFVLNAALYYLEGHLMLSRVAMMMAKLKEELYQKVTKLSADYLDESHSGDIQSRISNNLPLAAEAISFTLVDPINFMALAVANLAFIAINSWKMALICLLLVAATLIFNSFFIKKIQSLSESVQENITAAIERFSDILYAIPIIRVFSLQQWVFIRYDQENQKVLHDQNRLVKINSWQASLNNLLNNVCCFIMLGIGALFLANGDITAGALLATFRYVSTLIFAITGFGDVMSQITRSIVSAERVLAILDYKEEPAAVLTASDAEAVPDSKEAIVFEDVSFSYQPGKNILSHLSFSLKKGEMLALVGPSGTGKTTVLNILMGFYRSAQSDSGIHVWGKLIKDYSPEQLRENFAYLMQDSYLFNGTIRENIAYGKPGATAEQVENAAKAAKAHDFIVNLPDGYDTPLGEDGGFLSGGEKQRISIARAFLKDAPILLMDEPTASLDAQTEAAIQEALERLMAGRTVIVVAHRLSTIQKADKIVIIENGKVSEEGSHSQLLAQNGRYAHYYRLLYNTLD